MVLKLLLQLTVIVVVVVVAAAVVCVQGHQMKFVTKFGQNDQNTIHTFQNNINIQPHLRQQPNNNLNIRIDNSFCCKYFKYVSIEHTSLSI